MERARPAARGQAPQALTVAPMTVPPSYDESDRAELLATLRSEL